MAFYMKDTDDEETADVDESLSYVPEAMYAQFGHWLTVDDAGLVTINRYAAVGATTGTAAVTTGLSFLKVDGMPDSATYNGDAAGMSVHKTTDEDGTVHEHLLRCVHGRCRAPPKVRRRRVDVTLGGTIDGFEGNAVDPMWTVELERRVFTGDGTGGGTQGSFTDTPGKTVASGRDGEWSATAYGAQDARPSGIFGVFNATSRMGMPPGRTPRGK